MILDCMIIDDEPLAHEVLETFISKFSNLRLVKKCTDAYAAVDFLYKTKIDLIFLDINMPEVDGITFLKSLKKQPFTIFTTAHREYALEGFELNITDFLLKPFSYSRFALSINKAMERIESIKAELIETKELSHSHQDFVFVKSGIKMLQLAVNEIMYIEAMKDYLKIYLPGQRLVVKETMKNMEDILPNHLFLRVHKSYIVSRLHMKSSTKDKIEIGEVSIPIGRNYQEFVYRMLKDLYV